MPATRRSIGQLDADVFTIIAHPVRRQILALLAQGDMTVTEIADPFEITRSAISHHLSILLDNRLVAVKKHGREHYYQLQPETLTEVYQWIKQFEHFWPEKLDALEAYLDEEYPPDGTESEL